MNPYYRTSQGPEEPKAMPYWQQRLESTAPRSQPTPPINSWLSTRLPGTQAPPPEPPRPKEVPRYPTVAGAPAARAMPALPPSVPPAIVTRPPVAPSTAWQPNLNPRSPAVPEPPEESVPAFEGIGDSLTHDPVPAPRPSEDNLWPGAEYSANHSDAHWISLKDLDGAAGDADAEDEDSHAGELDWGSLTGRAGGPENAVDQDFRHSAGHDNGPILTQEFPAPRDFQTSFEPLAPPDEDPDSWTSRKRRRGRRSERAQVQEEAEEAGRPTAAQPPAPARTKLSRADKARNKLTPPQTPVSRPPAGESVRIVRSSGPVFHDFDDDDDEDVPELREFTEQALIRVRASRSEELLQERPPLNNGSGQSFDGSDRPVKVKAPERMPEMKVRASRDAVLVEDDLVYVLVDDEGRPVLK